MIRFDNLSKRYEGGFEALRNVSFEMDAGEMAFLTGHSGAGKSTLLKLLMLIEQANTVECGAYPPPNIRWRVTGYLQR